MKFRRILTISLIFTLGAIVSSLAGWGYPIVEVKLINKTENSVSKIQVNYQNVEGDGVINLDLRSPLKAGEEIKFHFYVEGEGAFGLRATFEDGQSVSGNPGYVVWGESKKVEIRTDKIELARRQ